MTIQIPATFDRDDVPSMAFLKVLPAEQRGVFHSLMDALKAARDVVFRVGGRALDEAQVAQMACESPDVLRRVLPELEFTRFILRDEDGALYSPHLVERHIRRLERAEVRAERQRRLEEFQERQDAGEFAPDAGVKAMTSRANAALSGRPRKGETREEARQRRERELNQQREMRLLSPVAGGLVREEKNQNHFSKESLVLAKCQNEFPVSGDLGLKPVSEFPIDLELERDNNLSNSKSTKPAKTKTEIDLETQTEKPVLEIPETVISQTVARVLKIGRLPDRQAGFAKSICGRFLREGVPADVLVEAVKQHAEKMALNGDTANRMGAFCKPIERFWADHQAGISTAPAPAEPEPTGWEKTALDDYARAQKLRSDMLAQNRDFTAMTREWPEVAQANGLPSCAVERDAYLSWYRPQEQAA